MGNSLLHAALEYARRGWPVFPILAGKKTPACKNGHQAATTNEAQIQAWFERNPTCNLAVRCGGESRLVVLDVDRKETDGYASLRELEGQHGSLPDTLQVLTPSGGMHFYFEKSQAADVRPKVGLAPGLDLRGDDSYVLVPPSTIDGKLYQFEVTHGLDFPIAPLPAWLSSENGRKPHTEPIPDAIPDGQRNSTLVSLAGTMRRAGMAEREIFAALQVANNTRCNPPMPEAEVGAIVKSVGRYAPAPRPENGTIVVCIGDVQAEEVSWQWYPYIPKGKLTLLEGDPGIGKSWVTLAIATAVSLGKGLPGTAATESGTVLLASAEDGLGDTIRPRLDAMGANVGDIHAIKGALDIGNGGLPTLEAFIEGVKPTLVIIDPLVAYIGAGVDIHRSNETRAVMARLADIAEKRGCAILAVRHLTKGGAAKAIYRGLGSIDILAACRSVLLAGCDPDNPQKRGIVHTKSNLAPMGKSVGYELREGRFYWTGETDLTADRILAAEDAEAKSALDEAADFLKAELADGPVEAKKVLEDAHTMSISDKTLNRAKSHLKINTKREGIPGKQGGGKFVWELPTILQGQNCLDGQDGHIENVGHLNNSSFEKPEPSLGVGHLNSGSTLPCVKGPGACSLRTHPAKPFSCVFQAQTCAYRGRQ